MRWDETGGGGRRKEEEAAFLGLLLPSRPVHSHGKEGRRLCSAARPRGGGGGRGVPQESSPKVHWQTRKTGTSMCVAAVEGGAGHVSNIRQ